MQASDFEGIEPGDWILINDSPRVFYKVDAAVLYANGHGALKKQLSFITKLQVLTGKLSPWSSPYVPDWAEWCIEHKAGGARVFFETKQTLENPDDWSITARPSWAKRRGA